MVESFGEDKRRLLGITYTPPAVVTAMVDWAKQHGSPTRVVDAGAGAGAFTFAAADAFPDATVLAIEIDAESAERLKAEVRRSPHAASIEVLHVDYLSLDSLPEIDGRTLFIGNPPYVRHHLIEREVQERFLRHARDLGLAGTTRAGLHLYFVLQSRMLARPGDYGAFITAAEWLHTDYGAALRKLLADGMGGISIDVFPAADVVFPGVHTTAAITCFEVGLARESILFGRASLTELTIGRGIPQAVETLAAIPRWSHLTEVRESAPERGRPEWIRIGDVFRVSRGQVTGANAVWVAPKGAPAVPERLLVPVVSRAIQLRDGPITTARAGALKRLVSLPADLDSLDEWERSAVDDFMTWAEEQGAGKAYVARHRRAWWAVEPFAPAPILCSYMARRPPVFALNPAGAPHLNIAHGLYPKRPIPDDRLASLVQWLNANVSDRAGRTYAGALVKFEPADVADILIPSRLVLGPDECELTQAPSDMPEFSFDT